MQATFQNIRQLTWLFLLNTRSAGVKTTLAGRIEAVMSEKKRTTPNSRIIIGDETIAWSDQVKYLGLTLDRGLSFYQHMANAKIKF